MFSPKFSPNFRCVFTCSKNSTCHRKTASKKLSQKIRHGTKRNPDCRCGRAGNSQYAHLTHDLRGKTYPEELKISSTCSSAPLCLPRIKSKQFRKTTHVVKQSVGISYALQYFEGFFRETVRMSYFKIALRDWNIQARLKISSEPPPNPYFVGGGGILKMKISSEIEIWSEIEWTFLARLFFFEPLGFSLVPIRSTLLWSILGHSRGLV